MAIGDTYQIAIKWDHVASGTQMVNVWHFRQESAEVQPTPSRDLFTAVRQDALPEILPAIHQGFQTTDGTMFNTADPSEGEQRVGTALTGGGVAECMPFQTSALIHWLTGLRGRAFRGRTFLPPFDEAGHDGNGVLDAGTLGLVADFGAAMLTIPGDATHGEWKLMVRSETLSINTPVTSFSTPGILATLRRRKLGG